MAKITPKQMIEYFDQNGSLRLIEPAVLHVKAIRAGEAAAAQCVPTPMVIQNHSDPLDDNSPVVRRPVVPSGVCGFASVHVRFKDKESRKFLQGLLKVGIASRDENDHSAVWRKHYHGGFYYWVSTYSQSMEIKEAFAGAMVKVLGEHGVVAHMMSRMD